MWLVLAVALFTADTRLYSGGCAPIDTASAVVPMAEFRAVVVHLEERKSLLVELATCQDLVSTQAARLTALSNVSKFDSVALAAQTSSTVLADSSRKVVVVEAQQASHRAAISGFWRGLTTGTTATLALSLLMVLAVR